MAFWHWLPQEFPAFPRIGSSRLALEIVLGTLPTAKARSLLFRALTQLPSARNEPDRCLCPSHRARLLLPFRCGQSLPSSLRSAAARCSSQESIDFHKAL